MHPFDSAFSKWGWWLLLITPFKCHIGKKERGISSQASRGGNRGPGGDFLICDNLVPIFWSFSSPKTTQVTTDHSQLIQTQSRPNSKLYTVTSTLFKCLSYIVTCTLFKYSSYIVTCTLLKCSSYIVTCTLFKCLSYTVICTQYTTDSTYSSL